MHAVILFAHGSRDPAWARPIEAVAQRMRERSPDVEVRCAYLELTRPDLPETAAALVAAGAQRLRVVPMFLGVGRHAREDLPLLMQTLHEQHPQVEFELCAAVGENPQIVDALAQVALG
ncbi:CbiX/SirB N-terminal domain-containing protein [Curvibacter sp. RS43]|uniref:CbiX/SirB N-terminal domain-containing protein n=1 Tax=Curvibacter microcysteis TaxID=3026419 RepID=A0ABT5MHN5_9BURK|nr:MULTISPECIES: CbiX/SirB N-terminal domain-containing protein [unclassified Curvibacter]MDD0810116.1 CbiX/SirB N-terminal domain-containing protein [Curvibacter sp. RS43]MDD0814695.1 CbiX/SirB N-terminal domain-containing protein [Curvibacter sp. HBC28]